MSPSVSMRLSAKTTKAATAANAHLVSAMPSSMIPEVRPEVNFTFSECVESRSNLECIQRRTLRFEPNPEHVAPNACCNGIAFHTDLKCCCRGVMHDLTSGRECPCLKIDYTTL